MYKKPTSESYFEKLLETTNLNWKEIYILPRKNSIDTNLCMFQYKILNHILFLSKLLLKFKKVHHHCVLFATLWMKRCCISSTLVTLQSDSGTRFNGLFLRIFTFLKSLHRVSSSDSLIKTEFSINQPFTTNFQALSVYVRRTWSCLFY